MSERGLKEIVQSIAWHSINNTCNDEVIVSLVKEAYRALGSRAVAPGSPEPIVSVLDDELVVEWPGFMHICMDDDGFGYAVNETGVYRPGKFNEWPAAAQEIKALLAARAAPPVRSTAMTVSAEPVGYVATHATVGIDRNTFAKTETEATSRLMMVGVAGDHGWSIMPVFAAPPPPADTVRDLIQHALLDDEYFGNRSADQDQLEEQARGSAVLIAEKIAALSVPAPIEAGWRDISTAPKDGTHVDIWSPSSGRHPDAAYNAAEYTSGVPWGWGSQRLGRIRDASHWMPTPAPPRHDGQSGGTQS
ncbi:hypothetical protein [Tardiphaga sp. 709]|uniref:hypothetical protein n=1 Tax=Tardiphaga sp. 709 TaxID=3076039 RepID=UPI0028EB3D1E|nr:hypothetical protein [Tardiphaga sp. 709]WNV09996.1 hypothetical protein RSO67_02005 [Tardiphaga sp. 709]